AALLARGREERGEELERRRLELGRVEVGREAPLERLPEAHGLLRDRLEERGVEGADVLPARRRRGGPRDREGRREAARRPGRGALGLDGGGLGRGRLVARRRPGAPGRERLRRRAVGRHAVGRRLARPPAAALRLEPLADVGRGPEGERRGLVAALALTAVAAL